MPHHDRAQGLEHTLSLSLPKREPTEQRQRLLDGLVNDELGPWCLQREWEERIRRGNGTQILNANFAQELGQRVNVTADTEL
eukprot:9097003-Lingulodinium_polyedra.AAC.1